MYKIVLASASPRRKELLEQIGMDFIVQTSTVDEKVISSDPVSVVKDLSRQKAEDVAAARKKAGCLDEVVIGADTIVVYDGKILGKPKNEEDAIHMLSMLQGNTHSVYTGVTMIKADKQISFAEETQVVMYPVTDEEIRWYVGTGEPADKAGAYGIQGLCARFIEKIHGDYNNVVGLPVGKVYQMLKEF